MSLFRFGASAPSNIALIKYMGKIEPGSERNPEGITNLPENSSLSMTLHDLCTFAELSIEEGASGARWVAELPRLRILEAQNRKSGLKPRVPELKEEGIAKVLRHLERVVSQAPRIFPEYGLGMRAGPFGMTLRTANTFPAASGIASSASSFAAITLVASLALASNPLDFERVYGAEPSLRRRLAGLSRMGSGSSCRSFEGPWVRWEGEETSTVVSSLPDLSHFVLVVSEQAKRVSSSQAHSMVKSSPLWSGRVARVQDRLDKLQAALESADLSSVARIAWREAWEMHSLFHTSVEPFSYWEPETLAALQFLSPWIGRENPPIVTLDAGPNVHVIVERRFAAEWKARLSERFSSQSLLEDRPGRGALVWMEMGE